MDIQQNLRLSLLIDFYGSLLTEKQRDTLVSFLDKNISLSELAQMQSTTRQAINDIVKRTINLLEDYESKLHLLTKFETIKHCVANCLQISDGNDEKSKKIAEQLNKIMEVL